MTIKKIAELFAKLEKNDNSSNPRSLFFEGYKTHSQYVHAVIDTTLDTHLSVHANETLTHTHTAKCYVALSVSRQDKTRQDETQKTCGALLDSACGCCKNKKKTMFFKDSSRLIKSEVIITVFTDTHTLTHHTEMYANEHKHAHIHTQAMNSLSAPTTRTRK